MFEPVIHKTANISTSAILGVSYRPLLEGVPEPRNALMVDEGVHVGEYCIVGDGCHLFAHSILDHYSHVEPGAQIGSRSLLIYRAHVCSDSVIGTDCIVGGFVGERSVVGNRCRIFGELVHHHVNPTAPWDAPSSSEGGVIVQDDCFIGFRAIVSRPVTIGPKAYVCAGAVVTRNVPPFHIAYGANNIVHFSEWQGSLKESPFFFES
jgi:acetyltransferase-like isoleucine patch superfamily enzyme